MAETAESISCAACRACCCRLEVLLMSEDDRVPDELTEQDEHGVWVMQRGEDGWCVALDRLTMRCTIYSRRPQLCREYEAGSDDCRIERAKHGL